MHASNFFLLAAVLWMGSAQATSVGNASGYDRVGVPASRSVPLRAAQQTAPGESGRERQAVAPERRREMARRLVWLMLSAR